MAKHLLRQLAGLQCCQVLHAKELLQPRARVNLHDLKARPKLNGREGENMKYDDSTQRYAVITPYLLTSRCVTLFLCLI